MKCVMCNSSVQYLYEDTKVKSAKMNWKFILSKLIYSSQAA